MADERPVCEHCGSLFCLLASTTRCRHTRRPRTPVIAPPAEIEPVVTETASVTPLVSMTRSELDAYAAERGIDSTKARTKAGAIALIEGA